MQALESSEDEGPSATEFPVQSGGNEAPGGGATAAGPSACLTRSLVKVEDGGGP